MEIALCYIDIIVPVPYRYSTGSSGSVPVSAVRRGDFITYEILYYNKLHLY